MLDKMLDIFEAVSSRRGFIGRTSARIMALSAGVLGFNRLAEACSCPCGFSTFCCCLCKTSSSDCVSTCTAPKVRWCWTCYYGGFPGPAVNCFECFTSNCGGTCGNCGSNVVCSQ